MALDLELIKTAWRNLKATNTVERNIKKYLRRLIFLCSGQKILRDQLVHQAIPPALVCEVSLVVCKQGNGSLVLLLIGLATVPAWIQVRLESIMRIS
jgi:hypothetical protein